MDHKIIQDLAEVIFILASDARRFAKEREDITRDLEFGGARLQLCRHRHNDEMRTQVFLESYDEYHGESSVYSGADVMSALEDAARDTLSGTDYGDEAADHLCLLTRFVTNRKGVMKDLNRGYSVTLSCREAELRLTRVDTRVKAALSYDLEERHVWHARSVKALCADLPTLYIGVLDK